MKRGHPPTGNHCITKFFKPNIIDKDNPSPGKLVDETPNYRVDPDRGLFPPRQTTPKKIHGMNTPPNKSPRGKGPGYLMPTSPGLTRNIRDVILGASRENQVGQQKAAVAEMNVNTSAGEQDDRETRNTAAGEGCEERPAVQPIQVFVSERSRTGPSNSTFETNVPSKKSHVQSHLGQDGTKQWRIPNQIHTNLRTLCSDSRNTPPPKGKERLPQSVGRPCSSLTHQRGRQRHASDSADKSSPSYTLPSPTSARRNSLPPKILSYRAAGAKPRQRSESSGSNSDVYTSCSSDVEMECVRETSIPAQKDLKVLNPCEITTPNRLKHTAVNQRKQKKEYKRQPSYTEILELAAQNTVPNSEKSAGHESSGHGAGKGRYQLENIDQVRFHSSLKHSEGEPGKMSPLPFVALNKVPNKSPVRLTAEWLKTFEQKPRDASKRKQKMGEKNSKSKLSSSEDNTPSSHGMVSAKRHKGSVNLKIPKSRKQDFRTKLQMSPLGREKLQKSRLVAEKLHHGEHTSTSGKVDEKVKGINLQITETAKKSFQENIQSSPIRNKFLNLKTGGRLQRSDSTDDERQCVKIPEEEKSERSKQYGVISLFQELTSAGGETGSSREKSVGKENEINEEDTNSGPSIKARLCVTPTKINLSKLKDILVPKKISDRENTSVRDHTRCANESMTGVSSGGGEFAEGVEPAGGDFPMDVEGGGGREEEEEMVGTGEEDVDMCENEEKPAFENAVSVQPSEVPAQKVTDGDKEIRSEDASTTSDGSGRKGFHDRPACEEEENDVAIGDVTREETVTQPTADQTLNQACYENTTDVGGSEHKTDKNSPNYEGVDAASQLGGLHLDDDDWNVSLSLSADDSDDEMFLNTPTALQDDFTVVRSISPAPKTDDMLEDEADYDSNSSQEPPLVLTKKKAKKFKHSLDTILAEKQIRAKNAAEIAEMQESVKRSIHQGGFAKLVDTSDDEGDDGHDGGQDEKKGNDGELLPEHKEQIEKLTLAKDPISDIHPGENIFNLDQIGKLFSFPNHLSLASCGFTPTRSALDRLLDKSNPENLLVLAGTLEDMYYDKACPDAIFLWLFNLMSIHPSDEVSDRLYGILWSLLNSAADQCHSSQLWIPQLKDMVRVISNYGASVQSLFPAEVQKLTDITDNELRFHDDKENHHRQVSDSSSEMSQSSASHEFPARKFVNCVKVVTHAMATKTLKKKLGGYTDQELIVMMCLICKVALEVRLQLLAVKVDFQMCIAVLLECIKEENWTQRVQEICRVLPSVSDSNVPNHHHNKVYIVQLMPTNTPRGRFLKRRLSYNILNGLLPSNNNKSTAPVDCLKFKLSDLHSSLQMCKPCSDTDYYLLNSLVMLIDMSVGNESLGSSEREGLNKLEQKLRSISGDIKESVRCLHRSKVKDLLVRTASKFTFMSQGMTQTSMYSFYKSDKTVDLAEESSGTHDQSKAVCIDGSSVIAEGSEDPPETSALLDGSSRNQPCQSVCVDTES